MYHLVIKCHGKNSCREKQARKSHTHYTPTSDALLILPQQTNWPCITGLHCGKLTIHVSTIGVTNCQLLAMSLYVPCVMLCGVAANRNHCLPSSRLQVVSGACDLHESLLRAWQLTSIRVDEARELSPRLVDVAEAR